MTCHIHPKDAPMNNDGTADGNKNIMIMNELWLKRWWWSNMHRWTWGENIKKHTLHQENFDNKNESPLKHFWWLLYNIHLTVKNERKVILINEMILMNELQSLGGITPYQAGRKAKYKSMLPSVETRWGNKEPGSITHLILISRTLLLPRQLKLASPRTILKPKNVATSTILTTLIISLPYMRISPPWHLPPWNTII